MEKAEFKGTKGVLELKFVSGVCIGIGTIDAVSQITANSILPDTDEEYEKEKEEILANMTLYATAPELLEALQVFVNIEDLIKYPDDIKPEHIGEATAVQMALNKAKKVIQKATKI